MGVSLYLVANWQDINVHFRGSSSSRAYSENQQRVIANFGLPQTFTFSKNNNQTLENWKYIFLDEIFIFQDGEFIARQHYNFDVDSDEAVYLSLEPQDLYAITTMDDLNDLLHRQPSLEADIEYSGSAKPEKFISYDHLLNAIVSDNELVGIQTIALKAAVGSERGFVDEKLSDPVASGDTGSDSGSERAGKLFIGNSQDLDNSFSYYLEDPIFRLIKQRPLHFEGEYPSYGYCYSLDQGASFETEPQNPGACADEESMVWVINLYPLEVYENFGEMDMMGLEELVRNEEYVFTITHTNGDLPDRLPIWPQVLNDVKNDFSVPVAEDLQSLIN